MPFKFFIILFTGLLLFSSCESPLYKPTMVEVQDSAEFNALQKGRNLYIRNCNSCHNLYLPSQFSAEKWKEELSQMQKKTKLTDTEVAYILKYVTFKKELTHSPSVHKAPVK
jgi:hypothetical protein